MDRPRPRPRFRPFGDFVNEDEDDSRWQNFPSPLISRAVMPKPFSILAALLAAAPAAIAAGTAFDALKLLPPGAAGRVARIQAHEGQPSPDRWHFLVHDPREESGLHEYVVAGGEVVASRAVSQFAESLSAEDVVGEAVKVDSDRVAKLAQQYAQANSLTIASLDYELKKPGEGAAPLWKVTCLDDAGRPFGHLMVTATRGTVVAHDGFPTEPAANSEKSEKSRVPAGAPLARGAANPEPRAERSSAERVEKRTEVRRAEAVIRPGREPDPTAVPEPASEPAAEPEAPRENRPGFLRRVGGSLQKVVTGRDTVGQ